MGVRVPPFALGGAPILTPVDVSKLDVNVTEHPHCRRVVDLVVPPDIVEAEAKAAFRDLASGVRIKGFRKGRVPKHVLAARHAEIEGDVRRKLVQDSVEAVVKDRGLAPVGRVAVETIRFRPGEPLSFRAVFDVRPEIVIERVHGFRQEPPPEPELDDEEVDRHLEQLRRDRVGWRRVEHGAPKAGDAATVVISRADAELGPDEQRARGSEEHDLDGEQRAYKFVLGQAEALPGIEQAVESLTPKSEGVFDVAFPGSSESEPGETRTLRIRLLEREVPELPELNDHFAASLGDFESLEALRSDLRSRLTKLHSAVRKQEMDADLFRQVMEANDFQVPRSMVEDLVAGRLANLEPTNEEDAEELRAELWEPAEMAVKQFLFRKAMVEKFGLAPTEEELDEAVEKLAEDLGQTPSQLYADLQKSGEMHEVVARVEDRKVTEFLRSRSPFPEE